MNRKIPFSKAINEAIFEAMKRDSRVICYGLGTDDPKGVFGTTVGLQEQFGADRVFDMPTAENGMTGVAVGAAIGGLVPVMCHQRLDFFLLAMDQLVNNAAKWHYMFGGKSSVPLTIRLIVGRGWGQGPTHSQNLHAWFAHIPGLKVVTPTTPYDAKGLLIASIFDPNPVVFIEHRWLHNVEGDVPEGYYTIPIGTADLVREGKDLTIVSMSYMTIEARHALASLEKSGLDVELIDLRSMNPIDWPMIFNSVKKTGRLLVLDTANQTGSLAGEIVARIATEAFGTLKVAPQRICLTDTPTPTSPALTKEFYRDATDIVRVACKMLEGQKALTPHYPEPATPHDVPGAWFKGPF